MRTRAEYSPIKVASIEMSEPVADLNALDRFAAVRALICLHDVPIGYVHVAVERGKVSAARLVSSILRQHGPTVLRHLVRHALESPLDAPNDLERRLRQSPAAPVIHATPLVTVAVCTRDRPADLQVCLNGLGRLRWSNLELLVIDNAPATNASRMLVEEHYPRVRYVKEPRPGLDWARNRAIAEARGEIIAYADDDVVVDPGWVSALVRVFTSDPGAMAVTGLVVPYELETEAQFAFEDHRGFESGFERTWNRIDREAGGRAAVKHGAVGKLGTGANMAFRKRVFEAIGGFDPALDVGTPTQGGGDLEMFFRVIKEGHLLVREPRAIVFHRHRRTYPELRTQISTWGIGMYSYVVRSCRAYPDERLGFLWIVTRWLVLRNIRRFARSLYSWRLRRELLWDEIRYSFLAPVRYANAVDRSREIEREFGPAPFGPDRGVPAVRRKAVRRRSCLVRHVDLGEQMVAMNDVADAKETEIVVHWIGAEIGVVRIANRGQAISAARLRDAIADRLSRSILARAGIDPPRLLDRLLETPAVEYSR